MKRFVFGLFVSLLCFTGCNTSNRSLKVVHHDPEGCSTGFEVVHFPAFTVSLEEGWSVDFFSRTEKNGRFVCAGHFSSPDSTLVITFRYEDEMYYDPGYLKKNANEKLYHTDLDVQSGIAGVVIVAAKVAREEWVKGPKLTVLTGGGTAKPQLLLEYDRWERLSEVADKAWAIAGTLRWNQ